MKSEAQNSQYTKDYSSMIVRNEPLLCAYQHEEEKISDVEKQNWRQKPKNFPSLSEGELVRHYHRLARLNYSWDDGLYPLGSCTMKYNPIICEKIAATPEFLELHPALPDEFSQGALRVIYEVQIMISKILDLPGVSLTPAAGAHGELAGVLMMTKYFQNLRQKRKTILIPDSAHGTNPASAAMGSYSVKKVPSNDLGLTDIQALRELVTEDVAALMITNPNTLGIFEKEILVIKEILEEKGCLLYVDGANLNAVMDIVSFQKMGVDLTQLNLHKTFSTPHGGGGPGQGALVCSARMTPYMPSPVIVKKTEDVENSKTMYVNSTPDKSIGPIKSWHGQFANILRAWVYLKSVGSDIRNVSYRAVVNANYLKKKLSDVLECATNEPSMHEVVFTQKTLQEKGATTMNFAKALLDRGFYAPTVYFPLHVNGAIMVEPTETESKQELDKFISAVHDIFRVLEEDAEMIKLSPNHTFVKGIDDVGAARKPVLTWDDNVFSDT